MTLRKVLPESEYFVIHVFKVWSWITSHEYRNDQITLKSEAFIKIVSQIGYPNLRIIVSNHITKCFKYEPVRDFVVRIIPE